MKKSTRQQDMMKKMLKRISICLILLTCITTLPVQATDETEEKTVEIKSTTYEITEGYISKIKGKTTVKLFKENIETEQEMVFKNKKGTALKETAIITTESTLTVGDETYTLIVRGDIDGNGSVTTTDLAKLKLYTTGKNQLTEAQKRAGDIDGNGEIDDIDVKKLNDLILGIDIDYEFDIENLKTYNNEAETNIFYIGENVIINFHNNDTRFQPKKMKINGKEYSVTKKEDNLYEIIIDAFSEAGNKSIKLEEVAINNGQKYTINETVEVKIIKNKPTVDSFVYEVTPQSELIIKFNFNDEDEATKDVAVIKITDGTNELKTQNIEVGENIVELDLNSELDFYYADIIATYHLEADPDSQEYYYENEVLLQRNILVSLAAIELKEVTATELYYQNEKVEKLDITNGIPTNLDDYYVKITMKDLPTYYANVGEITKDEENEKLFVNLDQAMFIEYEKNGSNYDRQNEFSFQIPYIDGDGEHLIIKKANNLFEQIANNPTGTFTLEEDLDASDLITLSTEFRGTINGNGHKIYNLKKPLFNTVNGATIENFILEDVNLSDANSKGTIANTATNITIRNVHVRNLNLTSKANQTAGLVGTVTGGTIEQCSVTNFVISTSGHIRVAAIAGYISNLTVKNCYVQGTMISKQSKDGNGIAGIAGHDITNARGTTTIENCITKVKYQWTGGGKRLNGDIIGITTTSTILKNNVSLSSGTVINHIYGSEPKDAINQESGNNYELEGTGLVSNASESIVDTVKSEELDKNFFVNTAKFNEDIWRFDLVKEGVDPILKNSPVPSTVVEYETFENKNNIPNFEEIRSNTGYYRADKEILYYNLSKLIPFADTRSWLEIGQTKQVTELLETAKIKFILPLGEEDKLIVGLPKGNEESIKKIRVVYENEQREDFTVEYLETLEDIVSVYKINEIDLKYQFDNYIADVNSDLLNDLATKAKELDYATQIASLTSESESRLYVDFYNESVKSNIDNIILNYLMNDIDSPTYNKNKILQANNQGKVTDEMLTKILYAYNYYEKWYHMDLNGVKISDLMFFNGKKLNKDMTPTYMINSVINTTSSYRDTGNTHSFYANFISGRVENKTLANFLAYLFKVVAGYDDPSQWLRDNFNGILFEQPAISPEADEEQQEKFKQIEYRAWPILTKTDIHMILPILSAPQEDMYIITFPSQYLIGSMNRYREYVTKDGQERVRMYNKIKNWAENYIGIYYGTSATFVPDAVEVLNRQQSIQFDSRFDFPKSVNVPNGGWQNWGTAVDPVVKWVYETRSYNMANAGGSPAAYAWYDDIWWVVDGALGSVYTFTHETAHVRDSRYFYGKNGRRGAAEAHADGVLTQMFGASSMSFNLLYNYAIDVDTTSNLSRERINSPEKIHSYYKEMYETKYVIEYLTAKAFLKLTPEEQSKIAVQIQHAESGNFSAKFARLTADDFKAMNLKTIEDLWDNHIALRTAGSSGASTNGTYSFPNFLFMYFYIPNSTNGMADEHTFKATGFEMLGYAGYDQGFINYRSNRCANDQVAIQAITGDSTMTWKRYKMSRYENVENNLENIKYFDIDTLSELIENSLKIDAQNSSLSTIQSVLRVYYGTVKRATNDFRTGGIYDDLDAVSITSAQQLVDAANNGNIVGNYRIDADLDFSDVEPVAGRTYYINNKFLGTLDGNGHKFTGMKYTLFNNITFANVKNITIEEPEFENNVNAYLAASGKGYAVENINVHNSNVVITDITTKTAPYFTVGENDFTIKNYTINSVEDFLAINNSDIARKKDYTLTADLDFTGINVNRTAVVTGNFTGKINGNGHTISNLTGAALFANFRGTVENLNLENFVHYRTNTDYVTAFTQQSYQATFRNMKFNNIQIRGKNNAAVVSGMDGRENANSVFENISITNSTVTGYGVYDALLVGRKWGGVVKNIYVQGTLVIEGTENGGVIGATQQNIAIENIISDVTITKSRNTYSPVENSMFNASMFGNIYETPVIKNCIAFGNMTGYTDASGVEFKPYKLTGATEEQIIASMTNCYEVTEETGFSRVSENTKGKLDSVSRASLTSEFYKNLGFDEEIWNFNTISSKGYPELK